jgi:hypothetical protein
MARLIAEILNNQTDQVERVPPAPALLGTASRLGRELARIVILVARLWYITLPALFALFLFAAKVLPSLPGLASRSARRRTKASWRLCQVRMAGVGIARRPTESPLEHAARICAEKGIALAPFADLYLKASFGESFDAGDEAAARAARRELVRSYRRNVSWPRRVIGVVNPIGALSRRS